MFSDRYEAGRQLAKQFSDRTFHNPLVLAIPRGGVAVGSTLAHELNAELDVVLVAKLRTPHRPDPSFHSAKQLSGWVFDCRSLDSSASARSIRVLGVSMGRPAASASACVTNIAWQ